jgi:hypothetical protein
VKLGFTVKATTAAAGSTAELAKTKKGSVASITKVVRLMKGDNHPGWRCCSS